jgi:hypothetical protein
MSENSFICLWNLTKINGNRNSKSLRNIIKEHKIKEYVKVTVTTYKYNLYILVDRLRKNFQV